MRGSLTFKTYHHTILVHDVNMMSFICCRLIAFAMVEVSPGQLLLQLKPADLSQESMATTLEFVGVFIAP